MSNLFTMHKTMSSKLLDATVTPVIVFLTTLTFQSNTCIVLVKNMQCSVWMMEKEALRQK